MKKYLDFPEWIEPQIFPGLPIRWYGLMYLVVILVTYLLFLYQAKREKEDFQQETAENLFIWIIVGALLGARIFATTIFSNDNFYWTHPWLIFWPFQNGQFTGLAGMNYYGGVLGGAIAFIIVSRRKKLNMLHTIDMLLAGFPLGYTFGRLGNFINGELYGRVTTVRWGMVFPHAERFSASKEWVIEHARQVGMVVQENVVNLPRHPSQLYEAFFEGIVLWLLLWFVFRRLKKFDGFIMSWYLVLYGVLRFFIDYFRPPINNINFFLVLSPDKADPNRLLSPWNFSQSQFFSFLMIAAGIGTYFLLKKRAERLAAAKKSAEKKKLSSRKLRKMIK